jgi:hypothetical protein
MAFCLEGNVSEIIHKAIDKLLVKKRVYFLNLRSAYIPKNKK